ncbi:amino acid adenylation domain-containing protein [Streptomyces sp. NPDC046215]|uniref:Carrier domain-containing protein n=1 Tax=Streptomyces stramineus TaxID=173861 RepID=A0ABP3JGN6_9ACTN
MTTALNEARPPAPDGTDTLSVAYGRTGSPAWDVLARYDHWVRHTPDAPAVEDAGTTFTYAELDALAARFARTLGERVRPGDLVGVCLDRSAALVATAIALARLGAVYLPLGPRPGDRRLAAVTEGLGVACLVGAPGALPAAYRAADHVALPAADTVAAFAGEAGPGRADACYAVLTSGSTGTPKAVAVGAAALGARVRWYHERTRSAPGDRHSLSIGVSFDPHVLELWAGLCTGGILSVPPEEARWEPAALTDWWREAGVTVAILPTPLAELVLERPWPELPRLRHLSVGGDRLRRWPGPDVTARVDNAYGPAEATVITTAHLLAPAGERSDTAPPIGLPVDDTVVCVADEAGRVVPRGEPGELLIGGPGLAAGYLDEELTARRFVTPPPGVTGTDRVYRSGDRVLMRADGVLEFLGRLDDQVKVSGVRVEPAEVEAALEHDPRVRRAVVAVRTGADGAAALAAFVQPVPGRPAPPVPELLNTARDWLPAQAVPAVVRYVDAFPLDANGKVDRAALVAAEDRRPAGGPPAGGSPTEELVLRLCRALLDNPGLGPADNFADSGGTSLAAARLLAALEEECGVRLRAPELLRQPDLRRLAALVESRTATAKGSA